MPAHSYLAEEMSCYDLMIVCKNIFKNLGCYIKFPILNVVSIKTSIHQQGKQNVSVSHIRQSRL